MNEHEVIVIGAGPAGSCAANLLARAGASVVVLERERFPRFHVGESLLPTDLPIFERLGVEPDGVPFLRKRGAIFLDEREGKQRTTRFDFTESLPGTPDHAYQVERAVFDEWLLRAAERAGARVREGCEVVEVELGEAGGARGRVRVRARLEGGGELELRARYLIDASGSKALLARRARTVEPYKDFGRAAVYRHYTALAPEAVAELHERGDIIIKIVDDGWMWAIPLASGALSVGLVKTKDKIEARLLDEAVDASPILRRLTLGAARGSTHLVGNYSYRNTAPYGPRYACVGDAACFLDPVFSSGVTLALVGAERLADILAPALAEGREAQPELMAPLGQHMGQAYDAFARFIERFYNSGLIDNVIFGDHRGHADFRGGVISMLVADVWREDNPFQNMLMRARRR